MTSKDSLRAMAVSVAAAGIMDGLSDKLKIARPTAEQVQTLSMEQLFTQHLQYNLVNAGVSTTLQATVGGQDLGEALKCGVKGAVAGTIGGTFANQIGLTYRAGELNGFTHKLCHGLVGGATGALLGDDPLRGATAGAMGAMVAEMVMESLVPDPQATVMEMENKAHQEGRTFDFREFEDHLKYQVHIAKLAVAITGIALNQEVNVATSTATNAIENNSLASALSILRKVLSKTKPVLKKGGTKGAKSLKGKEVPRKEKPIRDGLSPKRESKKQLTEQKEASHRSSSTQQPGDPKNVASHEKHKVELRKQMQPPHVEDPKLEALVNYLHRETGIVGNGSTAAAVREEIITGKRIGGKFHTQKATEGIENLQKWLTKNPTARSGDRAAAENMVQDLLNALNTKN